MADLEKRLLIDGELMAGEGAELAVENRATEETVATLATPSSAQANIYTGDLKTTVRCLREIKADRVPPDGVGS